MTLRDILDSALALLGSVTDDKSMTDIEERAPYIGAALCTEAAQLDRAYRAAFGLEEQPDFHPLFIDQKDAFPLSDRFAPAASYYMAAMLVLDTNSRLYDELFDNWCTSLAQITSELPFVKGKTTDIYP